MSQMRNVSGPCKRLLMGEAGVLLISRQAIPPAHLDAQVERLKARSNGTWLKRSTCVCVIGGDKDAEGSSPQVLVNENVPLHSPLLNVPEAEFPRNVPV